MDAIRTQLLKSVCTAVESLALPEVAQVTIRNRQDDLSVLSYPSVVIRRADGKDIERRGTAEQVEVGYGVEVLYRYRVQAGPEAPVGLGDRWYETLASAFRDRLPALPDTEQLSIGEVKIEPLPVLEIHQNVFQLVQGGLVARIYVFQDRG